jgi:hypothetical protein
MKVSFYSCIIHFHTLENTNTPHIETVACFFRTQCIEKVSSQLLSDHHLPKLSNVCVHGLLIGVWRGKIVSFIIWRTFIIRLISIYMVVFNRESTEMADCKIRLLISSRNRSSTTSLNFLHPLLKKTEKDIPNALFSILSISLMVKREGREADFSSLSTAEIKECVELYLHSPNTPSWRGAQLKSQGQLYLYLTHLQNNFCNSLLRSTCAVVRFTKSPSGIL